jgi:hypothetical protein
VVFDAAWVNHEHWTEEGIAPPEAAPIETDESGMTSAVDELGNARGGLRTPAIDVPTGTWYGNAAPTINDSLICFLAGYEVPFDKQKLAALYPSHDDYVQRVEQSAEAAVRDRFLLEPDAQKIIEDAMQADIP